MKKIVYMFFVLFLCFLMTTNVYASDGITIKSITLDSKSDRVIVREDTQTNGLEFSTGIVFVDVNDYAKFNIEIENNTDKDYMVSEDKAFSLSDYVEYKYSSDQVIKHNDTSTISVTFKYVNEVDPSLFFDEQGGYGEINNAIVELVDAQTQEVVNPTSNDDVVNPNTGFNAKIIIFIAVSLLLNVIALVFIRNKTLSLVLIIAMCLIPSFTYAIEELHITMNVEVFIAKKYKIAYTVPTGNVLLKDDEMDDYAVLSDCKTVYAGSVSEENRYNYCKGKIIRYDTNEYTWGERAKLNSFEFRYLDTNLSGMPTSIGNDEYLIREDDVKHIKMYIFGGWTYNKNVITSNGFTYNNYDKNNMEFSEIYGDGWDLNGAFTISDNEEHNVTFTMPNHDTLFVLSSLIG